MDTIKEIQQAAAEILKETGIPIEDILKMSPHEVLNILKGR